MLVSINNPKVWHMYSKLCIVSDESMPLREEDIFTALIWKNLWYDSFIVLNCNVKGGIWWRKQQHNNNMSEVFDIQKAQIKEAKWMLWVTATWSFSISGGASHRAHGVRLSWIAVAQRPSWIFTGFCWNVDYNVSLITLTIECLSTLPLWHSILSRISFLIPIVIWSHYIWQILTATGNICHFNTSIKAI